MTALRSEEFLTTLSKSTSSREVQELSDRHHLDYTSVSLSEEHIYEESRTWDRCERTSSQDEERDETRDIGQTKDIQNKKKRTSSQDDERDVKRDMDRTKDIQNNKISKSEVAGNRLYMQAKQRERRLKLLRQRTLLKPDNSSKRRKYLGTMGDTKAKRSKTTPLYSFGKSRLTVRRNMPATISIDPKPSKASKRVTSLYELGKSRVTSSRQLAATRLIPNNQMAKITALSDTKPSASEIAGGRLYNQAQLRGERKKVLGQKARAIRKPQMEMATQQRNNDKPIKWGASPTERFFALYEQGKNRVTADRELEIKHFKNNADTSNEDITHGYANLRQIKLYELGKQKLISERISAKQHSDLLNDYSISSQLLSAIVADANMTKLNEMSKVMAENGIDRREESIEDKNTEIYKAHHSSKRILPNATMVKLYSMSHLMQEHGKERREKISDARVNFPVIIV